MNVLQKIEQLNLENTTLFLFKLPEITNEELNKEANAFLSKKDLAKYNEITSYKRRKEWLYVRQALYTIYEDYIQIEYAPSGKPFIDKDFISISHKDMFLLIGISKKPIGVDIERLSEKIINLKRKFVEDNLISIEDLETLTIIWAAKEAAYKLISEKGISFKKIILKCLDNDKNEVLLEYAHKILEGKFFIVDRYVICFLQNK